MAGRRWYDDGCATAHAMDVIGERWALLVVRELLLGPKRFTDLRDSLPGASANMLAQRLRELEAAGVLRRTKLPPPVSAQVYELTEWGMDLEPVILQLGLWGHRSPGMPQNSSIGPDALVLSLRARFNPVAAKGLRARYQLRLRDHRYRATVADGIFTVMRGEQDDADALIACSSNVLGLVVSGLRPLTEMVGEGRLTIEGDRRAAERFLRCFR